jgi:hypothetical protein
LNAIYYQSLLDIYEDQYDYYSGVTQTEEVVAYLDELDSMIDVLNSQKSAGWSVESSGEIDSIYKAMGVRAGVNIKF